MKVFYKNLFKNIIKLKHVLCIIYTVQLSICSGQKMMSLDFDGELTNEELALINLSEIKLLKGDKNSMILVEYIGYPHGSRRVLSNIMIPGEPTQEATLKFKVKFSDEFSFVKGGKLHGFGPSKPVSGGNNGGPDKWSARLLFKPNGKIATYTYHQDQKGIYGEGITSQAGVIIPGKFQQIEFYIRINTPFTAKNGQLEVKVDGTTVIKQDGLQFRSVDGENTLISQFLFSTFHGGNTPDFAPRNSLGFYSIETAYFDDIEIYKGRTLSE